MQAESRERSEGLLRLVIVLLGIWIGQFALFGPSLLGSKILLPLDILAAPGIYIPTSHETAGIPPHDGIRSDTILQFEPERRFIAGELAAGRYPAWQPFQYGGVPTRVAIFAPLYLLKCSTISPLILAWAQFVLATIAGLGAYRFFRTVVGVSFWSAAIPAWCYPLSGAFALWQGYPLPEVICWLPWLLVAVERAVERLTPSSIGGLALTTCLVLLTVSLDIAGLTLAASGIFGLWQISNLWLISKALPMARKAGLALILGWGGGFLLAAPYLLPMLEYTATGARMETRAKGVEERPPIGLSALPQTVLPDFYGATKAGSYYLENGNLPESSASAYAGLLATLLVAPLAWNSRRHRSFTILSTVFFVLGLAWAINCPGLIQLFRLPGLNMFSFNRFVFLSGFAILMQAAIGLETLSRKESPWKLWYVFPALACAGLAGWCYYRAEVLPEPVATQLAARIARGEGGRWGHSLADIARIQDWFRLTYQAGGAICLLTLVGWLCLWRRQDWQPALGRTAGLFMMIELLLFAFDRSAQCDPKLYYPPIPALQQAAESAPGRIVGYNALPANLAQMQSLSDVRGYDAVDPKRFVELVRRTAAAQSAIVPYAVLQYLIPAVALDDTGELRLPAILDMLGVRYVVFRGVPSAGIKPDFISPDYYIMKNRKSLPRAFVPRRVVVESNTACRLDRLSAPDFDPRAVAYVETEVDLPNECRGEVSVTTENPTRMTLSFKMNTPGMVVLSDRWDNGWAAYLDNRPVPILYANHALRGVIVPAGVGTLEFRYEPATFRLGLAACGAAIVGLLFWSVWFYQQCRRQRLEQDSGFPANPVPASHGSTQAQTHCRLPGTSTAQIRLNPLPNHPISQ